MQRQAEGKQEQASRQEHRRRSASLPFASSSSSNATRTSPVLIKALMTSRSLFSDDPEKHKARGQEVKRARRGGLAITPAGSIGPLLPTRTESKKH